MGVTKGDSKSLDYSSHCCGALRAEVCMSDKEGVQWQCYVKSWIKKSTYPEPFKAQPAVSIHRSHSLI